MKSGTWLGVDSVAVTHLIRSDLGDLTCFHRVQDRSELRSELEGIPVAARNQRGPAYSWSISALSWSTHFVRTYMSSATLLRKGLATCGVWQRLLRTRTRSYRIWFASSVEIWWTRSTS